MHRFDVPDMSCGHCVAAVTEAIQSIDQAASVDVDLENRELRVASPSEPAMLAAALLEAGYPAQLKTP